MGNEEGTGYEIMVSVIVVAYNCAEVIGECIQSCLHEVNLEIIIIDNASKDETAHIVQSIKDERLRLIVNSTNRGFTQACNQGIEIATGKYVMLMNPDASLQAGCSSSLVKYLDEHSHVGIVAPCLYYPNGEFQNYTRTFPTVTGLWVESFVPMKYWNAFRSYRNYTCQNIDFTKHVEVDQPAGAALMMRQKWLLDETYFIYGSDVDLCKSVIEKGYQIVQTPEAKVIHHQSKGGTENNELRLHLDADNYYGMKYYFRKHGLYFSYLGYCMLFFISLFLRFIISFVQRNEERKIRYKKLKAFVLNQNFKMLYEKR